jgi:hypothetical protein
MGWPVGDAYRDFMQRTSPGDCDWDDDRQNIPGTSPIKLKVIPRASTGRLFRRLSILHEQVHTTEGLRQHDASRRSLIESAMKTRAITHELILRGHEPGECFFCWGLDKVSET